MKETLPRGVTVVEKEPMSRHTTIGIGGPADFYAEASTLSQLKELLLFAKNKSLPIFYLGAGSNLLVGDGGIEGLVVRMTGEFESIIFDGRRVRAGAGVFLPVLVRQAAEKGLGGIEPLVGVPGTVGGALVMNAGTREGEIGGSVVSVEVMDPSGGIERIDAPQIRFSYRSSSLAGRTICFATLELRKKNREEIAQTIQRLLSKRLQSQPIGTMNLGSVFKNPEGRFAGVLIEQSGLKGKRVGKAAVSTRHANFIVNEGGASARDVRELICEIQKTVLEKHGVELQPEVKRVGRD